MIVIKRHSRNIEVWQTKRICVEREGNTLSLQVRYPGGEKAALVLDVEAATELASILPDATAIPGVVVCDVEKVGGTSNE